MLKKLKITVDGRPYTVTVEDVTEDTGQQWYPEPGLTRSAVEGAEPAPAAAPAPEGAPPSGAPAAAGAGDEPSPLSGVVISIDVAEGQQVNAGDKIATLEAMKMKTVVAAKASGTVKKIHVQAGDGVEAGQALMTIG
jgi:biotin carboxyl carrier protein